MDKEIFVQYVWEYIERSMKKPTVKLLKDMAKFYSFTADAMFFRELSRIFKKYHRDITSHDPDIIELARYNIRYKIKDVVSGIYGVKYIY